MLLYKCAFAHGNESVMNINTIPGVADYFGRITEAIISGMSMYPVLRSGDRVIAIKCTEYFDGDIVIFPYKDDGIICHRLLLKEGTTFYCKGDNSFRLEDVPCKEVLGKIVCIYRATNKIDIPTPTKEFLHESYQIGRLFHKLGYDKERVCATNQYRLYAERYLKNE